MNDKNRHSQPFAMVLIVTIVLLVASKMNTQLNLFGFETKKVDPLSDIQSIKKIKTDSLSELVAADSTVTTDSMKVTVHNYSKDSANIVDFKTDTTSALSHFFQALNITKKQKHKTRIAYFGDSMIEGDLITQDLREFMQDRFGGSGVGFLPITSIVAGFRCTVFHSFNGWSTYNLLNNPPQNHVLGISGYGFVPNTVDNTDTSGTANESWVKYIAVNKKHLNRFYQTKLLYGKSDTGNYVSINGSRYLLKGRNAVNELLINSPNGYQSINARFQCKTPPDIFGFSMESDSGVFVDNFSFRGNSGMPDTKVLQSVYSGTNNCLGYDLIILEYGLNAVNPKVTDFSWYERGMNSVIKLIQASFPQASILLISVGDKSYRNNGVYETDPSVPILVETQRKMAKNNKIAFWSLYDAMGGNGSMVKWVEGDTVLANKDYTHFNFKGAHKTGKLLYGKLMKEYNNYNKKDLSRLSSSVVKKNNDSIN
jgi:hypothetical protein